jgi:hypothetical protein
MWIVPLVGAQPVERHRQVDRAEVWRKKGERKEGNETVMMRRKGKGEIQRERQRKRHAHRQRDTGKVDRQRDTYMQQ